MKTTVKTTTTWPIPLCLCRRAGLRAVAAFALAGLLAASAEAGILKRGDIIVADTGNGLFSAGADGAIFEVDPNTGERVILSGRGVGTGPALINPLGVALAQRDRRTDRWFGGEPMPLGSAATPRPEVLGVTER